MTKLDRILAKPHKVLLWSFTGLIVAATAFTLFESNSTTKRINDKKKRVKRDKSVEEIERDSKDVSRWSKKELFDYLTRHQVYPDVETEPEELVKLVKSIKRLYPDIDYWVYYINSILLWSIVIIIPCHEQIQPLWRLHEQIFTLEVTEV